MLPKSIKVWMRTFTVEEVEQGGFKTKTRPEQVLLGEVDWDRKVVRLLQSQSDEDKEETLYHELFHIANDLGGSSLKESQIDSMSKLCYYILKSNGMLKELS